MGDLNYLLLRIKSFGYRNIILFLLFDLVIFIASCSRIRPKPENDYSYDKGKPCTWYKLSSKIISKKFNYPELYSINCSIKADIEYVRLNNIQDVPWCSIEACPELLDRIEVSMEYSGRVLLKYSKCIQDHRLPIAKVVIASHDLQEVIFLGNSFFSRDTILGKSGILDLYLKYRGSGFNVVCNVPLLRLKNDLYGEAFKISGISDSVSVELLSGNRNSKIDLRGLNYRSLNYLSNGYPGIVSFSGSSDFIYYDMRSSCIELKYRGNPILVPVKEYCESVKPESY
jgi:hypothetical protein